VILKNTLLELQKKFTVTFLVMKTLNLKVVLVVETLSNPHPHLLALVLAVIQIDLGQLVLEEDLMKKERGE